MDRHGHHHTADPRRVRCAVLTVSDTRTAADDTSGQRIQNLLLENGHEVTSYRIVPDEPAVLRQALLSLPQSVEAVIVSGGTGLARRDTTFEAVRDLLDKEITGFGELFRMLSYNEVGALAMLSRAVGGVAGNRVVFSLPGATEAVELAMTRLILPALGHVVGLVRGQR